MPSASGQELRVADLGISTWLGAPAAELRVVVLSPAEDLAIGPPGAGEATPGLQLDGVLDDQAAGRGAVVVALDDGGALVVGAAVDVTLLDEAVGPVAGTTCRAVTG